NYSKQADIDSIKSRFDQILRIGGVHFALLFDDIPDNLSAADIARFGNFASAQAHVASEVWKFIQQRSQQIRMLFCPTAYCGRMANRQLGGANYLSVLGRELSPDVSVFWTGPEIISQEISVAHIREIAALLRRKPMIWDNLHANDYDGRRFFVGPYSGRPRELLSEVSGILTNPNCEFHLNYLPIFTLGDFINGKGPWQPRDSFLANLPFWLKHFDSRDNFINANDLLVLCDCYYLPHKDGPEAESLSHSVRHVSERPQDYAAFPSLTQRARRLREFCSRLAEIENRPLFYALSRRIWELREELDLLEKFVTFRSNPENAHKSFASDFHLLSTYRGGFVARLQKLLLQNPDGSFTPLP
ncbi:MAG TPA: beta-N-acetylglucosaminidase domain-containing protein, partial [Verrucomicrobiae bacterium]|nr:beta-N-acetylglucosaminidase domain-containing protein [Verrucomicrobiae bacterium]